MAAEIVRAFLAAHVPEKDAKAVEEGLLTKSIVMTKRQRKGKESAIRRRKGFLTSRSRRQLGVDTQQFLGTTSESYAVFQQQHVLWCRYIRRYLGLEQLLQEGFRAEPWDSRTEPFLLQLYRADLHGARLRVIRSRCASYRQISGLVLQETKHTFRLLTDKNQVRTVPKQYNVFGIDLPPLEIRLFESNLNTRPAHRGSKKPKGNTTIKL